LKTLKNKRVTALKAFPQQEFQKCFQQWQAASFSYVHICSRGLLRRWPLSVSCKYKGMRLAIKLFRELKRAKPRISPNATQAFVKRLSCRALIVKKSIRHIRPDFLQPVFVCFHVCLIAVWCASEEMQRILSREYIHSPDLFMCMRNCFWSLKDESESWFISWSCWVMTPCVVLTIRKAMNTTRCNNPEDYDMNQR